MKRIIFIAVILFSQNVLTAQVQNSPSHAQKYKDFLTTGNTLVGLTSTGHLTAIDLAKGQHAKTLSDTGIAALSPGLGGKLIVLNNLNQIISASADGKGSRVLDKLGFQSYQIVTDSKGNMYSVSRQGIQKVGSPEFYLPDTSYNKREYQVKPGWLNKPDLFMASDDRLWIGFNHGEWGGEIFIFDTKTSAFSLPKLDSLKTVFKPIRALVGKGNTATIVTGGGGWVVYGAISESDGERSKVLYSYRHQFEAEIPTEEEILEKDMRFSSAVINPKDGKLYLSNDNGIFVAEKADVNSGKVELKHISKSRFLADRKSQKFSTSLRIKKIGAIADGRLVALDHDGRLFICDRGVISPLVM